MNTNKYGLKLSWDQFKDYIDGGLQFREIVLIGSVRLVTSDGDLKFYTIIHTDGDMPTEWSDYQTNYQSLKNQPVIPKDSDGANVTRMKAAKKGWTYTAVPIEFQTSKYNSAVSDDYEGNPRGGITHKIYDASDVEITSSLNELLAVKTIIDFEPTYDYEIIGGTLRLTAALSTDIRLWIVAVPDIPSPTGSKEMVGGFNLKYLGTDVLSVDGRVAKFLPYDVTYHTNKLRFIFKYGVGLQKNIHIIVEHYKA